MNQHDQIARCLNSMKRIAQAGLPPRFDFPRGDRVSKGFTYGTGSAAGRPRSIDKYRPGLTRCLDDPERLMFLYPGHYGLAVIDIDTPHNTELRTFLPPLHWSLSRSGARRGGHLWYTRPRYPGDIKPLSPRSFHLRGEAYVVDVQYTQLIRVPSSQVPGVLDFIAQVSEEPPSPVSFPYEILGLALQPGERDSKLWHYILAQTEQLGDPDLVSEETWREVATEIGYFVDNTEEAFEETFRKATDKAQTSPSGIHQSFNWNGAKAIFEGMCYRMRFNQRNLMPELLVDRGERWAPVSPNSSLERRIIIDVRDKFILPQRKSDPGVPEAWDPRKDLNRFRGWLGDYAAAMKDYDPVEATLRLITDCPTPLDDDTDVIYSVFDPPLKGRSEALRAHVRTLEQGALLAYWLRLESSVRNGGASPDVIHFPCQLILIGPPGCGKSRFWQTLAFGFHSNSIKLGDPMEVMVPKAMRGTIIEIEEMHRKFNRPRSDQLRGYLEELITADEVSVRLAYAPSASEYRPRGLIVGTANQPLRVFPDEGLFRRLRQIPVQVRSDWYGDAQLGTWLKEVPDLMLAALARAKLHADEGRNPLDSLSAGGERMELRMHQYLDRLELRNTSAPGDLANVEWTIKGSEFD